MRLPFSLLWAGMALVVSAKSDKGENLDRFAPRDTQGCVISTSTITSTQTSTVNSTVTNTEWVTQYVNAAQSSAASVTGASGTGLSYTVVNISPTSTGASSSASASVSTLTTSTSSSSGACPSGAVVNFTLEVPEYTAWTGIRGNTSIAYAWHCMANVILILKQYAMESNWTSQTPVSEMRCALDGYPDDPANATFTVRALPTYPWLTSTDFPAGGVINCMEDCTSGNVSLSVPSGMSIQDAVTGDWTVGPGLQSVERICDSGPYSFSIVTNDSTTANCMLSGYASVNDTVRTFDLQTASPWSTNNISVWVYDEPLSVTCWTPTTQPLNCSANTNSSTGGVTVNMVAGNSTVIGFDRGYEVNGTAWEPVELTGYNTGSMNRLCGQQPASVNASVWATGADMMTTPAMANLTCLLSGYPASGETPTVSFSNTAPYWSLLQEYGDMYMDCTTS
ncbi:hypothetical protein JCM24511_09744 [Saitozyma sp. JCM 24511]|nr:hypothetical protein JCM24511_09744 [Saitozyma sp. JCM 24511]